MSADRPGGPSVDALADAWALPACRDRSWTLRAIELLQGDRRRSADTHLLKPVFRGL